MPRLQVAALLCFTLATAFPPQGGGPCKKDWDCSLGGLCTNLKCDCDAWTTGPQCGLLNLVKPSDPATQGLQDPGYFSWGGHPTFDKGTGLYQGFFSFMCKHQTLSKWTSVSSVVRATSTKPEGPYTAQKMVVQPWAHNTMLTYDPPSKSHVLFFIGTAKANQSLWDPCIHDDLTTAVATVDSTAIAADAILDTLSPPAFQLGRPPKAGDVSVATAPSLTSDNWTIFKDWLPTPVAGGPNIDFTTTKDWSTFVAGNPAPYIFENGTTLLFFSAQPGPKPAGNAANGSWGMSGTVISVARAEKWQGPYKTISHLPVTRPESEDPYVFRDARKHFHLLTNVNNGHARCPEGVACGGHAWSEDGITWSDLVIGAYGPRIPLMNGTFWQNSYIERPQLLQEDDGTPIAFFTGMGRTTYTDSCSWVQKFCSVKGDPNCAPTGVKCDYKSVGEKGYWDYRCPGPGSDGPPAGLLSDGI